MRARLEMHGRGEKCTGNAGRVGERLESERAIGQCRESERAIGNARGDESEIGNARRVGARLDMHGELE
jgi:hypothetical protein